MPDLKYDVLGIGNAIVDVIARTEDDFLVKQGMNKGGLALIDEPRAQAIYGAMSHAVEKSGGSAATTVIKPLIESTTGRISGIFRGVPAKVLHAASSSTSVLPAASGIGAFSVA